MYLLLLAQQSEVQTTESTGSYLQTDACPSNLFFNNILPSRSKGCDFSLSCQTVVPEKNLPQLPLFLRATCDHIITFLYRVYAGKSRSQKIYIILPFPLAPSFTTSSDGFSQFSFQTYKVVICRSFLIARPGLLPTRTSMNSTALIELRLLCRQTPFIGSIQRPLVGPIFPIVFCFPCFQNVLFKILQSRLQVFLLRGRNQHALLQYVTTD